MARRDFRRGAGAISRKRETLWIGFTPAQVTLAAAGGTLMFSMNAAALALRPFTIVRTRLDAWLQSDQTAAAETFNAALGIAVVSDESVAIGVTAIPTPVTDVASDLWMLYEAMTGSSGIGGAGQGLSGVHYGIDSKAMRKVQDGQDVVVVAESGVGTVGQGSLLTVSGRMLGKLH